MDIRSRANDLIVWLRNRPILAFIALGAIVVLSLLPGPWQQRTGLPPPVEHLLAYLGTAGLMGVIWPGWRHGLYRTVALGGLSALLEYLQNFSPGRDPRLTDVAWSSSGALLGTGLALLVILLLESREQRA